MQWKLGIPETVLLGLALASLTVLAALKIVDGKEVVEMGGSFLTGLFMTRPVGKRS